jgi:hypothetical protein
VTLIEEKVPPGTRLIAAAVPVTAIIFTPEILSTVSAAFVYTACATPGIDFVAVSAAEGIDDTVCTAAVVAWLIASRGMFDVEPTTVAAWEVFALRKTEVLRPKNGESKAMMAIILTLSLVGFGISAILDGVGACVCEMGVLLLFGGGM